VYEEEEVEDLEDARNSMEAFGLLWALAYLFLIQS
jgi:hypothetical protein